MATTSGRKRGRGGGAAGNLRLTAAVGAVLILLLAVEGATIPWIGGLITVHIVVGMLLLGPLALKLATTGYRFARYYAGSLDYVEKGPPALLMRVVVAPVLVLSTLVLFGTGVALIAFGLRDGVVVGLHKVSFVVWFGATSIHVLAYTRRALRSMSAERSGRRIAGARLRLGLLVGSLVAGVGIALATLPQTHSWVHSARAHHHDDRG